MGILINHTLRSIREHKGQSLVIVVTVAVVTMLFFVSLSIGDLFYNLQLGILSRVAGETDVHMSGELFSGEMLDEFVKEQGDKIEYVDTYLTMMGLIGGEGKKEATVVRIEATNMNAFLSSNKDKLTYNRGIEEGREYVYPGIMIGKALSEKQGYDVGDEVEIYVSTYERNERFTVTYIFENEGFFANSTVYTILADLNEIGDKGLYTDAYFKLADGVDKETFKASLSEKMGNPTLTITDAVDYEYIERVVGNNQNLLTVGILFIVAIVLFILTGAYLVLAKNRAKEMTVFKAAGATPIQTFFIILSEGIVYGAIGGLIGTVAARLAMQIAVISAIPTFKDAVTYSAWNYLISTLLGIVISTLSELIPAIGLIKNSVKKADMSVKKNSKIPPLYLLIPAVVAASAVVCIIFIGEYVEVFTVLLILAIIGMMIIGAPYLLFGVSSFFKRSVGSIKLSSSSVKRNGEAVSLSCMIGAIIAFTFIAVSIVNVIIGATRPYNSRFEADYTVQTFRKSIDMNEINQKIKATPGVEYSCLLRYEECKGILDGKESNYFVYSAGSSQDLRCAVQLTKEEAEEFDNEENAAVFGYDMMNRMKLKVGEKVNIFIGDSEIQCKIIAVDNTTTATDRVIYLNEASIKNKLKESLIFVKVRKDIPSADLYADLRETLKAKDCFIIQFNNWAYATSVGIGGVEQILRFLQIIIGAVCLIGIVNMTISMMISREREFGIYRSVGLDNKKFFGVLVGESLCISLTGGIIGFVFSIVINILVPSFAMLIDRYVAIVFPIEIFVIIIAVIVLYLVIYCLVGTRYSMKNIKIERNKQ